MFVIVSGKICVSASSTKTNSPRAKLSAKFKLTALPEWFAFANTRTRPVRSNVRASATVLSVE